MCIRDRPEAQVESRPAEDLKPAEDLFAGMDVGASELVQVETTAKAEPSDYVEAQPRGRKPVHQAVEAAEEPLVQIETRSAEAEAPKTEADLLKSPEHMADVAQLITESFEKSDRRPRRSRRSKVKPDETVKTHLKPIAEAVAGIVAEPDPLGKIAVTAKALETKEEEAGKVQVQAEACLLYTSLYATTPRMTDTHVKFEGPDACPVMTKGEGAASAAVRFEADGRESLSRWRRRTKRTGRLSCLLYTSLVRCRRVVGSQARSRHEQVPHGDSGYSCAVERLVQKAVNGIVVLPDARLESGGPRGVRVVD